MSATPQPEGGRALAPALPACSGFVKGRAIETCLYNDRGLPAAFSQHAATLSGAPPRAGSRGGREH
jgi:hypothetical protein